MDDAPDPCPVARLEPQLLQAIVDAVRSIEGSPTAAQRYLEATGILSRHGWNRDSFQSTFNALQESCALDPHFALAPALLSLMYAISYRVGILHSPESEKRALDNAESAMQLDSMNSHRTRLHRMRAGGYRTGVAGTADPAQCGGTQPGERTGLVGPRLGLHAGRQYRTRLSVTCAMAWQSVH